ncbi:F-box protein At4g35930 isoform X1 [Cryptomeria japonica]|uniref:F-box protein At4g35930 isoform X1 n=1 Tax=Cryptomeria japonica TaxID=3369 RepID=UPI0025AB65DC|nr:F-box protein At4g35930 isoform X1 [Cryptomeria japonica]
MQESRSTDQITAPPILSQNGQPRKAENLIGFIGMEEWRAVRKPKKIFSSSSSLYFPCGRKKEMSRMKHNNYGNSNSKYLKPGALAQLRDARINTRASSCTAIGRKRVLVVDYAKINGSSNSSGEKGAANAAATGEESKVHLASPQKKMFFFPNNPSTPVTPKTPTPQDEAQDSQLESRLESLPVDLLLRILCLLHHDQLKTVFHVSQRLRKAALVARQCYFNYTTPDRSRQEMLRLTTPRPDEHWPFLDGVGFTKCPLTPKAPRHDQRPPLRLSLAEMRQISASLFQGPSSRLYRTKPPGLPRPGSRYLPSHRVLFNEDELCQAVSQNTLR